MERARVFIERLLGWAERTPVRDFAYRHETDPFRKLCLSVLLQRARPPQVDRAYQRLFTALRTVRDLADAPPEQIAELIRPSGMYRLKAERLRGIAQALLREHGGEVPRSREELLRLPGVGEYAADVVLAWAFGRDVSMVDANVHRILRRVGFIEDERETRAFLEGTVPRGVRRRLNLAFIEFGGLVCRPLRPLCPGCVLRDICRYVKADRTAGSEPGFGGVS